MHVLCIYRIDYWLFWPSSYTTNIVSKIFHSGLLLYIHLLWLIYCPVNMQRKSEKLLDTGWHFSRWEYLLILHNGMWLFRNRFNPFLTGEYVANALKTHYGAWDEADHCILIDSTKPLQWSHWTEFENLQRLAPASKDMVQHWFSQIPDNVCRNFSCTPW